MGEDTPVLAWETTGSGTTLRQLLADHQGSIIATAQHGWKRDRINTYDEYGIPGSGNSGRFQYTGQAWIPELGMYHYKARMYSPRLGRFLQTDPIGYEDQVNLYAYVANDPVNHIDPTGKDGLKLFIKQTIKHRGNIVEAAIDVADTAVTVFAPSSTPLERVIAAVELVSPVAPSDVTAARRAIEATGRVLRGRKGGATTRGQNQAIGDRIQDQGGKVTGGFNRGSETRFTGPDRGSRGSRFSDGSAVNRDGNRFQVQTVNTRADGTLTAREDDAARDIAEISYQPVVCVPKQRCN